MSRTSADTSATSLLERVGRLLSTRFTLAGSVDRGTSHGDMHDVPEPEMSGWPMEAQTQSADRWISRARPTFLYVIYAMILWALPMGLIAAISPRISHAITIGMTEYLSALPAELYTLFATGYLGYATLRQWGKVKGTDR